MSTAIRRSLLLGCVKFIKGPSHNIASIIAQSPVVFDCLGRATGEGLLCLFNFGKRQWLLPNISEPFFIISCEKLGSDFSAHIAINAGEIVIIRTWNIAGILMGGVSHGVVVLVRDCQDPDRDLLLC